jgi:5-methylcytosine-specific restriction endonuclease McrA
MQKCRICLRVFNELRFSSSRISICGRCVNTLNESREVAENAERRIGERLLRGIERNALRDIESGEPWQKAKAERTLSDIGAALAAAQPQWLNKVLADPQNTDNDFKLLRAHRRGLLHFDRPVGWGYPNNWKEVASRIRQLDRFQCAVCAAHDKPIDVHHIVYVSNFGTHQQTNLISLCRTCHETEHKRNFDLGEQESEQIEFTAEIPLETDNKVPDQLPPDSVQQVLPSPTFVPPLPNSILKPLSISNTLPSPTKHGIATKLEKTVAQSSYPAVAQRFCGYCWTLVTPTRRLLIFKQCPKCKHPI